MNLMMIFIVGIVTFVGTYLVLSKSLIRIVIGTSVLSHAMHLFILSMSYSGKHAPISGNEKDYVDSLPQSLILTAIVISFAITAFLLVLAYKTYQTTNTYSPDSTGGKND